MAVTPPEALKLGWSVIPVKRDKRPFVRWRKHQETRADESMIAERHVAFKAPGPPPFVSTPAHHFPFWATDELAFCGTRPDQDAMRYPSASARTLKDQKNAT